MLSRIFSRSIVALYQKLPPNIPNMSYKEYETMVNSKFKLTSHKAKFKYPIRVGVIGYKQGMTNFYNKWGVNVPCTVIQVDRCQILDVRTKERDGVDALRVGAGERAIEFVKKPQLGLFLKAGVPPKRDIKQFEITPDNILPPGYLLTVRHFNVGQFVDVRGFSKGKGFQGYLWL